MRVQYLILDQIGIDICDVTDQNGMMLQAFRKRKSIKRPRELSIYV